MNNYISFYNSEQVIVIATSRYEASQKALAILRAKYPKRKIKQHEVTSELYMQNGQQVVHTPMF